MKGLYCRAGVSDTEPKFVIQETVSLFVLPLCVDGNDDYYIASLVFVCNYGRNEILVAFGRPVNKRFTRSVNDRIKAINVKFL